MSNQHDKWSQSQTSNTEIIGCFIFGDTRWARPRSSHDDDDYFDERENYETFLMAKLDLHGMNTAHAAMIDSILASEMVAMESGARFIF